ncbi:hypothetical protein GCM10023189_31200 [Nibrella saemangeumensis]|uniref:KDO2-lipid IV(A) lauroyltransferase n=1 Tax=Nibrella saemangeumensis TaxID=1084526 RepID=A0ABP8N1Z6_9BACT
MQATLRQYYRELTTCRQRFEAVDLQKERGYLAKFVTFSANVQNILPFVPLSQHESLFRELLLQQVYTTFDQEFLSAGELVQLQGSYQQVIRPGVPHIYCTFHLGSYRLLTSLLYRRGLDCVLLVGSQMSRQQGESMQAHIDALRRQYRLTNTFRILEAGSPSSVISILRELKAGRSLIMYVDGSPETAPTGDELEKHLLVRFGNRQLLTRKGVGFISHAAKVPIVPVISYRRTDLTNVLRCLEPIRPDSSMDRETYSRQTMQLLYDSFWRYLNRYPGQWEGWNYIHSFMEPEKLSMSGTVKKPVRPTFNQKRYSLCDLEDAPVLFDRRLYETYEISPDLRDLLLGLDGVDSVEDTLGTELFTELVEKEILC